MKKCDKKAYKEAIKSLDLQSSYDMLLLTGNIDYEFDYFKELVKVCAIQATKEVCDNGYQHFTVDEFPVRATAWYDSGDVYCEVILYLQQSTGCNERPINTKADFCK